FSDSATIREADAIFATSSFDFKIIISFPKGSMLDPRALPWGGAEPVRMNFFEKRFPPSQKLHPPSRRPRFSIKGPALHSIESGGTSLFCKPPNVPSPFPDGRLFVEPARCRTRRSPLSSEDC